ncbi:response regulator transcription factor [Dethiothermospora halolimnae]|uniref:response regulator transcription factor n=1 Tax=Dethiothermospora halolimnae TaxID=3114390 RepID=UPI003CCB9FBC
MEDIKILVADDEVEIQKLLKRYLEREGYEVDTASHGQEAIDLITNNKYSLIVLDLMMPKVDGIEVCRRIRDRVSALILMLTAKDSEIDKVLGLSIGADDYITKPFSINEVVARVKAHLRRYYVIGAKGEYKEDRYKEIGKIKIDFDSYCVYINSEPVKLTAIEFKLLKFFINNPKQVFTKAQIFRNVWGDNYYEDDNTVMVHIRRLRKKIEDNPKEPKLIQTVWGIGYKFTEE